MLPWACLLTLIAADPPPDAAEPRTQVEGLPAVNFLSDTGLGLGVYASVEHFAEGRQPYQFRVDGQAFATTGGSQFHYLQIDVPQLAGSAFRLDALAGYWRNINTPYFGIGEHGQPDPTLPYSFNVFDLQEPVLRVRARRRLLGPLSAIATYRLHLLTLRYAPDSQVALDAPSGLDGGPMSELAAGLVLDTRDFEPDPTRGFLVEFAGRSAEHFLGTRHAHRGLFATVAAYRALFSHVVLAARVAFDEQWGDVPVDRLSEFADPVSPFFVIQGAGGSLSVRGLVEGEYIARAKALANLELRVHGFDAVILQQELELGALAFADAGTVFGGVVHPGVGGGLRIAWRRFFVIRADVGYAEGQVRVYIDTGQVF